MDNQNILAVVAGEEITQKDLDALIAATTGICRE